MKPKTVYTEVPVSERLPEQTGWYNLSCSGIPAACGRAYFNGQEFAFTKSSAVSGLLERGKEIYWLEKAPSPSVPVDKVEEETSGIKEFDELMVQFRLNKISLIEFASSLWNKGVVYGIRATMKVRKNTQSNKSST